MTAMRSSKGTYSLIAREALTFLPCAAAVSVGLLILAYRLNVEEQMIGIPLPIGSAQSLDISYTHLTGLVVLSVPILSFVAALLIGRRKINAELTVIAIVTMLSSIGLIFLARLGPVLADRHKEEFYRWLVLRQGLWIGLGIVLMVWLGCRLRKQHYQILVDRKYLLAVLGSCLVALTAVVGDEINGRKLWLSIGGMRFQTIEFIKLLLVFFAAGYFSEKMRLAEGQTSAFNVKIILPFGLMIIVALFPIFLQGDLGPTFLIFCVFLVMFYIATSAGWVVAAAVAACGAVAVAMYMVGWPQMLETRVAMWLDPFTESEHVACSIWAINAGGLWGAGLGAGMPHYVPTVYSDFIFSAIAEELGFIGVLIMLSLFGMLSICGFRIALRHDKPVGKLIAVGITTIFSIQTIIILGGISGLLPVTGITLPFVSYGGSSMLANYAMIGILVNISGDSHESE